MIDHLFCDIIFLGGIYMEKGTSFSTMFIYIAMVIVATSTLVNLSHSFSLFYILRLIIDCGLISSYYLLTKERKIGFPLMWLCIFIFLLLIYITQSPQHCLTIFFSSEFLMSIAVSFNIFPKLKKMK